MMRTKTLFQGFKNSQKLRVIVDGMGIYMTISEIYEKFATTPHRIAVLLTIEKLAGERETARALHGWAGVPSGLSHRITVDSREFDVQIDVM
jgi:hypothetical protein